MLDILNDRTYRHLFPAQVVALLGIGLATVALGLLAYDLAGDSAAMVLGTVFTIKMVAYVGIAPIAGAFADRVNRRALLVALDLLFGQKRTNDWVTEGRAWFKAGLPTRPTQLIGAYANPTKGRAVGKSINQPVQEVATVPEWGAIGCRSLRYPACR